jgi:gamma-glutamyl:cysteine ligase YbdK (ATP-grasp superfamily)
MGRDVAAIAITHGDRRRFREKIGHCLEAFEVLLKEGTFEPDPASIGLEIELNLVDDDGRPTMRNAAVLEAIDDPAWNTELAQFNVEVNLPPSTLAGKALAVLEQTILDRLNLADSRAREAGAGLMMVGGLPTLTGFHVRESALSANPRYHILNEQILASRGEAMLLDIDGPERLRMRSGSIAPEAACTSVQFHLQVSPEDFGAYWNASQAIAGVQVALAANSPYMFGRELWHETRIPLFEQATDTRSEVRKARRVRPRVWFGERWITSVLDLFEENIRYFSPLLPLCADEDPRHALANDDIPELAELRLHNGTIYRWNRPVYDIDRGHPHLRVENRVLPAGPTVVDVVANAAFYYGLVRALAEAEPPIWHQMPFATAARNLHEAARHGIHAVMCWPGIGEVPVTELVRRKLLSLAAVGLDRWGVDRVVRDRLLGVIEGRCATRRNGATWQTETVRAIDADRPEALRRMTLGYLELMHTNAPVHTWPPGHRA